MKVCQTERCIHLEVMAVSEEITESRRSMLLRRLQENGAEAFTNQELVELLLLYSIRQKDTAETAEKLFEYFGSMSEVLEAPVMELSYIEGVSRNSAVLLSMIPQIARRIQIDHDVREKVVGMDGIRAFVPKCFIGKTVEFFLLICLDKHQKMIRYDFVSKGSVNHSTVDLRKIIHLLLATNAAYAVVAHNHPRGNTSPSIDDKKTTQVIVNALSAIDVKLLDHMIVNASHLFSFAEASSDIRGCMIPD